MMNITPVILCGGSGTRLWPLSRADYPKQFIKLEDNITLFQKTINRIKLTCRKK
jgi:mannose-1-phosphate guanylyltransferase